MLNDCLANGKALIILSIETQSSSLCNTRRAETIFGSLVCALWEYPKCAARLVRVVGASAVSPATCAAVLDLELENNAAEIEVVYELPTSGQTPSRHELTNGRKVRVYDAINRGLTSNGSAAVAYRYTSDDTVIITGGTGSIGLLTTRSLIRLGCKRIALVSRSGRVADADQVLHADTLDLAEKNQATVQIFSCDVSVTEDVDRLFREVSSSLCAKNSKGITGIVHSAGILRDGLLCSGKAADGLEAVYTAKTRSCELLCEKVLAENLDLKIFLVFSSIAAATGNAGQASYAFSNRAIEVMMHERHAKGQSGLSIRLPGVIGAGMGRTIHKSLHALMASSEHVEQTIQCVLQYAEEYSRCGSVLTMMPNELFNRMKATKLGYTLQGIDAKIFPLGHSIISEISAKIAEERMLLSIQQQANEESVVVMKETDIEVTVTESSNEKKNNAETPKMRFNPNLSVQVNFDNLPPSTALIKSPVNTKRTPRTPSHTKQHVPDTRNIEEVIINVAKMLIQGGSERELNRVDSLMAQGMDSLCAAELATELSDLFNLDLPQTLVFTHPSIQKIAMYIYLQGSAVNRSQARTPRSSLTSPRVSSRAYTPRNASAAVENASNRAVLEDVGIVGVSMALPGDVNCLDELWDVLTQQTSTLSIANNEGKVLKDNNMSSFLPKITHAHRLNQAQIDLVEALPHHANGKSPIINEGEFSSMHLSHKLVLYHAQKALVDAGYASDRVPPNTAVFVGVMGNLTPAPSFFHDPAKAGKDGKDNGSFAATSHNLSVIAGRVSHALGLHGPSMAIDTACSSGLVALHNARRSLQLHECDVAIVAGVNVLDEDTSLACAMAHMLSTDGLCRSFDSAADGYGRSEGCAVIVLRRMTPAELLGNSKDVHNKKEVYGIIKGSAIKQDGASASLTAPNPLAQEMVLKQALLDAQMSVNEVRMLEAHGTGTIFGDPVEVQALAKVYQTHLKILPISASKSAFGHLEACSGLVGLFSVLLSLQHRMVPGVSNLHTLNPIVADTLKKTSLSISVKNQALDCDENSLLVGGVSSFGYSGTLAHVLVQAVPRSAQASSRLAAVAELADVDINTPVPGSNVKKQTGSDGNLNHLLHDYFGLKSNSVASSNTNCSSNMVVAEWMKEVGVLAGTVWQFSGQGSLVLNAGKALYDSSEVYRCNLRRCDVILKQQFGITAEDLLYPNLATGRLTQEMAKQRLTSHTAHSQAVLVALEISLCLTLIEETKSVPSAVIGHSLGEYSAMVCAGYWTPEQALNVVCGRGLAVYNNSAACKGVMHALRASPTDVQAVLDLMNIHDTVTIAAVNGDMSLVLSGDSNDVIKVVNKLKVRGVVNATIPLPVSHAFHSPLLKAAVPDFIQALQPVLDRSNSSSKIVPWTGKVKFVSTLDGCEVPRSELQTSSYWEQHLLHAVRYRDAVRYCASTLRMTSLLEIGPQAVLTKLAMPIVATISREERWSEEIGTDGEARKCDVQFCLEA